MKILVYGAGVLGCNLRAKSVPRRKGYRSCLRAENGRRRSGTNGLRIKDKFLALHKRLFKRIPVVTELASRTRPMMSSSSSCAIPQLGPILETLRANPDEKSRTVGNDVRARAL